MSNPLTPPLDAFEQYGFPLVCEGSSEGPVAHVPHSPVRARSGGSAHVPLHSRTFDNSPMSEVRWKGHTWSENCGSSFHGSPQDPSPQLLQQSLGMPPRVYSTASLQQQSSIATSFANWAIDRQAESPKLTPERGTSAVLSSPFVPPRPASAHPIMKLNRGASDAPNGQFSGFSPSQHTSPSLSAGAALHVPTRPRSANPIANGHGCESAGHGASYPAASAQPSSTGLLHQQLLRSSTGAGRFLV